MIPGPITISVSCWRSAGRLHEAVEHYRKALAVARQQKNGPLVEELQTRLKPYVHRNAASATGGCRGPICSKAGRCGGPMGSGPALGTSGRTGSHAERFV